MINLLEKNGYKLVDLDDASYVIVNTCAVKQATEDRVMHVLKSFSKRNKKLIIAGCLPKINFRRIEKEIHNFDAAIDPQSIHRIVEIIRRIENGEKKIILYSKKSPIKPKFSQYSLKPGVGIIQISEGCNMLCSYCCTRFGRGKLQCYPLEDIVNRARQLIKRGCKELHITSQDNGSYNFNGVKLPQLLNEICKIPGDFKIRVGMMNPTHIKNFVDELIEAYKNDNVMGFLHLPVQSGSDKILRAMKRGYVVMDFEKIVERFRGEIPNLFLSTDVIVGFPGETEEDFQATVELIKKIKPDKVNISKFGARPGTEAADLEQLDVKTINERSRLLHKIISSF